MRRSFAARPCCERRRATSALESVTLKLESLQHAGSFKARGSLNTALGLGVPLAGSSPPRAVTTVSLSPGPPGYSA